MRAEGPEIRVVTVRTQNSLGIFTGRCPEHAGWMTGREQQVWAGEKLATRNNGGD